MGNYYTRSLIIFLLFFIFVFTSNKIETSKKIPFYEKELTDFNILKYGAKGDGVSDDTNAIIKAMNAIKNEKGGRLIIPEGYIFNVTSTIYLTEINNVVIEGGGTLKWAGTDGEYDLINFHGNNIKGGESNKILVKDITVKNSPRFGIQIYGYGFNYDPHNIFIENVTTINNKAGGIFINKAHDINISDCLNIGGYRHIGIGATKNYTDVYNIIIKNCSTSMTTQFGYQSYYGTNIKILDNNVDGAHTIEGDKSGITIDRTRDATVRNNTVRNAYQNIFITGVTNVICKNNLTFGGNYGIQVFYNNEPDEDPIIKEANQVKVRNNQIISAAVAGIIFNGVVNSSITDNLIHEVPKNGSAILLISSYRTVDNIIMDLNQINVEKNYSDGSIIIDTKREPIVTLEKNKVAKVIYK